MHTHTHTEEGEERQTDRQTHTLTDRARTWTNHWPWSWCWVHQWHGGNLCRWGRGIGSCPEHPRRWRSTHARRSEAIQFQSGSKTQTSKSNQRFVGFRSDFKQIMFLTQNKEDHKGKKERVKTSHFSVTCALHYHTMCKLCTNSTNTVIVIHMLFSFTLQLPIIFMWKYLFCYPAIGRTLLIITINIILQNKSIVMKYLKYMQTFCMTKFPSHITVKTAFLPLFTLFWSSNK